jgi:hypothetical protein
MQVGVPEPYRAAKYAWEPSPTTAGNSCEQRGHGTGHPPCKAGCHRMMCDFAAKTGIASPGHGTLTSDEIKFQELPVS